MPLRVAVRDIAFFERPVRFVRPFRFGAVVINAASQAHVRAEIEVEGKGPFVGASAELLVPKWFDKRPHLSPEETVAELRRSLAIARELYLGDQGFESAFDLHARCLAAQVEACANEDISMCGLGPAVAMLTALQVWKATNAELIRYATSADRSGDPEAVVGYAGMIFS